MPAEDGESQSQGEEGRVGGGGGGGEGGGGGGGGGGDGGGGGGGEGGEREQVPEEQAPAPEVSFFQQLLLPCMLPLVEWCDLLHSVNLHFNLLTCSHACTL